jgi:CRP-like cAMP-binding protein
MTARSGLCWRGDCQASGLVKPSPQISFGEVGPGMTLAQPESADFFAASALQTFCRETTFRSGDILRRKGHHYNDMFLLSEGSVEVDFETADRSAKLVISGPVVPIGEIGFLRGVSATATVTARSTARAHVLDDAVLQRLEAEQPALATQFLRYIAETAEDRISHNLTFVLSPAAYTSGKSIDVYLCRNSELLESAQRLRYAVYCEELGRKSPYADHERKVITDHLDDFGQTFIALDAGETIGTLRGNRSTDGPLGVLEDIYGMRASPHHPEATGVCTKFIVKKSRRGGPAAIKLISALTRYGLERGVRECYIDCIPGLLPYYKALGFQITGPKFFHRENGPSYPMVLDLARYGPRLSRDGGPREYFRLFVRAEGIKLVDRIRRYRKRAAGR